MISHWSGRHAVTMTTQPKLSTALFDVVKRESVWTRSYEMPAAYVPIDDEEFGIVGSDGVLHIHSFETGEPVLEAQLEPAGRPPQILVQRAGSRYILVGRLGAPRPAGVLKAPPQPRSQITALDRQTGRTLWSVPAPIARLPISQPPASPLVILVGAAGRFDSGGGSGVQANLAILDARDGRTVYEGKELVSPDRIDVRVDPAGPKVVVSLERCRLELAAQAGEDAARLPVAPVKAPRPAPRG
jgi:hypothetical protein